MRLGCHRGAGDDAIDAWVKGPFERALEIHVCKPLRPIPEIITIGLLAFLRRANRDRSVAEFEPAVPQAVAPARTQRRRDVSPAVASCDRFGESHQGLAHASSLRG